MKKYNDKRIIGAGLIFLMVAGFGLVQWFAVRPLSMDLPGEFYFNGAAIALAWTDDNSGENLIIQSDKKQYEGFSSAEVYFSVTNISRKTQEMDMVFWLEDGERVVERVELLDVNSQTSLDVNKAPLMLPELGSVIASEAKQSRDGDWIAASRTPRNDKKRKSINGFTDGYAATDTIQSGETRYYKALLKYPARANGEFFIEAFGNNGGYGHLDPWYSSSYQYKRQITLNASQIATTTDAFPVLATTTLADLKTVTNGGKVGNDNGYDIIFVDDDDATLLNFEQEKYASTTGEIAYWIKTDISSTTDKVINMYYGNSGASDVSTTTAVWDDNFVMVNHLAHDGVATTTYPDFLDSTKYNNDGSSKNMNSDDLVDGQVDGSLDFDGVNDYVTTNNQAKGEKGTISLWARTDWSKTDAVDKYFFDTSSDAGRYLLYQSVTPVVVLYIGGTPVISNAKFSYSAGEVFSLTITWDTIADVYKIYKNGVVTDTSSTAASATSPSTFYLGCRYSLVSFFDGLIDEVRISNVARTEQWIATEYNNQSDVASFLTIGAEECLSIPATRSGGENVKTRIKGGVIFKGGVRF